MTETLAAVDIGTNSFHLVVARMDDDGRFEVIEREKEMVRLGSGSGGDMKHLSDAAIDRGIAALERMRKVAEIHGATMHAVATSAVREAENAQVFIDRARDEAGVEVEIISGVEEARLIHLGVLQAVPVFDKRLVLVDIGGGSTEIVVGERGEILASGSLKLGAIRMTRRFFGGETVHPGSLDACRRVVQGTLVPLAREVRRLGFDVAVGSSGTVGAVAALVAAARDPDEPPPRTFNNFELSLSEVSRVVERLVEAGPVEERRKLAGMDEKRADILLGGAVILETVMRDLGVNRLLVSDYALREGVLLDAYERERGGAVAGLHDLRRRSVLHLVELTDDDPEHSARVARLALELFDETESVHHLGGAARELLEAGALLANVGQFVSHSGHHKHSYYVIRNSEQLVGFTDHEIELIALIARYHRKSAPKATHPEFDRLRPRDQDLVSTLAGVLRVAIALDRSHSGAVAEVHARREGNKLVIEAVPLDGADISLELFAANERTALLERTLDLDAEVVAAATATS